MKHSTHQNQTKSETPKATQPTQTHSQTQCSCRNKKFHRGRFLGKRCPAPTLGSKDGLCTWCRNGHPHRDHHDETRQKKH